MDANKAVKWLSGHHDDLMKIFIVKNTPYGKIANLIQSLQAELNTSKSRGLELKAENDRLRVIEEKAKKIDKILNCWTIDEDTDISYDFEGICPDEWKCTECPLKEFKDALKGGS